MKNSLPLSLSATLLCVAFVISSVRATAAGEEKQPEKKTEAHLTASIRVDHPVAPVELPALAKVSFTQALQVALVRVPGGVIKAELEVEDGNLMYSFEIVNEHHKILEVEIDAGTGKVLDVDED